MENSRGTGVMAVFAVSGSVVFVAMQIHKRVLSSFMKEMEYEITNSTGAMKEVGKKKVKFAGETAEVVAEKRQAVASRRKHDQNFESIPLNWQVLYKGILKNRNPRENATQSSETSEVQVTSTNAACLIEHYREAIQMGRCVLPSTYLQRPNSWVPPTYGPLRLDADVNFHEVANRCSVGRVIRNHDGRLLALFDRSFSKPELVVMRELLAIREGLKVIQDNDLLQVSVYSGSLLAV